MALLASAFLAAMVQAAPADAPPELPGTDAVRSALERVFARPEFHKEKGWFERLKAAIWEKVGDFIEWVLSFLPKGAAGSIAEVVFWTLTTLLTLVLLRILWTSLSARRRRADAAPPEHPATVVLGPSAHLASATTLAGEGRFREAAHALYRGVVLWLDSAGLVRFEDSKTGGEYARELGGTKLSGGFREVLLAFYPPAFGGREGWREAYQGMRRAASSLGVPE